MADPARPLDELLTGLRDIRLPGDAPGGLAAEILVMVGLGAILALTVALVLKMFTTQQRHRPIRPPDLDTQIDALRTLPDEQRALALLHLIREQNQGDALPEGRYAPGGIPSIDALEAILLKGKPANA